MKATRKQSKRTSKKSEQEIEKNQKPKFAQPISTVEDWDFYKTTDEWAKKCKETFDLWQNLNPNLYI